MWVYLMYAPRFCMVVSALSPANVLNVAVAADGSRSCRVTVPDSQLSLAIGNKGQNVRLAARLTGWKIDIGPESQAEQIMEEYEQRKQEVQQQIDQAVDDLFDDEDGEELIQQEQPEEMAEGAEQDE